MSDQGGGDGRFRRAVRRITSDDAQRESDQLMERAERGGATTVARCGERENVTVLGTVRALTLRPRAGTPALEVDLYDGSGTVTLVWLGRREIAGVTPGRQLRATGRITSTDGGRRVIFNPRYELVLA
ncbi:MAG TPA: OB-fold nucleic acid binding domain-containing protein [Mycobacteriales bacterium]|nr:OB-fold nucleic acid binding domain-containing protein [Mycobacteriales bacterium]